MTWLLGVVAVGVLALRVNFFPAPEVALWGLVAALFASYVMTRWLWDYVLHVGRGAGAAAR